MTDLDPNSAELTREGWLVFPVSMSIEQEARAIRARRDRDYGNVYEVAETDLRWVGDLGELMFYRWLRDAEGVSGRWIRTRPAGKPDFVIHGQRVGLKTVERKGPFRSSYTAQITARHAAEEVEHFFFASYQAPARRLWLLGGIARVDFLEKAVYYGAGERVHDSYFVRAGHEIYNIEARDLKPPQEWLEQLVTTTGGA